MMEKGTEMTNFEDLISHNQWLEAQVEALELELSKMREENKRLSELLSNASWAGDAARDSYDHGRDGWN